MKWKTEEENHDNTDPKADNLQLQPMLQDRPAKVNDKIKPSWKADVNSWASRFHSKNPQP